MEIGAWGDGPQGGFPREGLQQGTGSWHSLHSWRQPSPRCSLPRQRHPTRLLWAQLLLPHLLPLPSQAYRKEPGRPDIPSRSERLGSRWADERARSSGGAANSTTPCVSRGAEQSEAPRTCSRGQRRAVCTGRGSCGCPRGVRSAALHSSCWI